MLLHSWSQSRSKCCSGTWMWTFDLAISATSLHVPYTSSSQITSCRERNDTADFGKYLIIGHSLMSIFSKFTNLPISLGKHVRLVHWEMSMYFNFFISHMLGGSVSRSGQAYKRRISRDFRLPNSTGSWDKLWQSVRLMFLSDFIPQMLEGKYVRSLQWSSVSSERLGNCFPSKLLLIWQRTMNSLLKFFKTVPENWGVETFSSQRLLKLVKFIRTETLWRRTYEVL